MGTTNPMKLLSAQLITRSNPRRKSYSNHPAQAEAYRFPKVSGIKHFNSISRTPISPPTQNSETIWNNIYHRNHLELRSLAAKQPTWTPFRKFWLWRQARCECALRNMYANSSLRKDRRGESEPACSTHRVPDSPVVVGVPGNKIKICLKF